MAETLAELSRRVDQLETMLRALIRNAQRNDQANPAHKDRREDEPSFEIDALIG